MMRRATLAVIAILVLMFGTAQPASAATVTGYSHHFDYVWISPVGWIGLEYDVRLTNYYDAISPSQIHIYNYSTMYACAIHAQRTYYNTGFYQNITVYWYIYNPATGGDIDSDPLYGGSGIWPWVCPYSDDWQMSRRLYNDHWPPKGTQGHAHHSTSATDGSYGGVGPWHDTYTGSMN